MKIHHGLNEDFTFGCDTPIGDDNKPIDPQAIYWTADPMPAMLWQPKYINGNVNSETGELTGGSWIDLGPPEPIVRSEEEMAQLMREFLRG